MNLYHSFTVDFQNLLNKVNITKVWTYLCAVKTKNGIHIIRQLKIFTLYIDLAMYELFQEICMWS